MQKAIYNGKEVKAFTLLEHFPNMNEIRKASKQGEFICCNQKCKGTLIYKCGDIKIPHFAHKNKICCSYAEYNSLLSDETINYQIKLFHFLQEKYKCTGEVYFDPQINDHYFSFSVKAQNHCHIFQIIPDKMSIEKVDNIFEALKEANCKYDIFLLANKEKIHLSYWGNYFLPVHVIRKEKKLYLLDTSTQNLYRVSQEMLEIDYEFITSLREDRGGEVRS